MRKKNAVSDKDIKKQKLEAGTEKKEERERVCI